MLGRVVHLIQANSVSDVALMCARRLLGSTAAIHRACADAIQGKRGLEIGGPSSLFSRGRLLPLYTAIGSLDNSTFSDRTMWEGQVREGRQFVYDPAREPGWQFIRDATDLRGIADASYQVVLSSNVLEHVANPIRALREWLRVLTPDGVLVLALPHREGTFDHRRPVTPVEHLRADFEAAVGEDDSSHVTEILALHDLSRDPAAGTPEAFAARCRDNFAVRGVHHHVFDTRSVAALVRSEGLHLVAIEAVRPHDVLALCTKGRAGPEADLRAALRKSPFSSDRAAATEAA